MYGHKHKKFNAESEFLRSNAFHFGIYKLSYSTFYPSYIKERLGEERKKFISAENNWKLLIEKKGKSEKSFFSLR